MIQKYQWEVGTKHSPKTIMVTTDSEKETVEIQVSLKNVQWNLDEERDQSYIRNTIKGMLEDF